MLRKCLLLLVCVMVMAVSANASTLAYNDCSSLDDFTSSNPSETSIVSGGGPESDDCVQFLSRTSMYYIKWDLPEAIDMSANITGEEMSLSFNYSAVSTYTEDTTFTAYATVDGTDYPIWLTSNLTADYTQGWYTWTGNLANTSFGGLIDSGSMTSIMFWVSAGSRFLQLDNLTITQVPEPASMLLVSTGFLGLCLKRKRG